VTEHRPRRPETASQLGSIAAFWPAPAQDEPINADGLRDILDGLLAEVFEFKRQFFHDVIVNAARDADTSGVCQPFQTCGDIHPVAENIPVLQHDVADVDADAKLHSAIFFKVVVRARKFILDVDRALDRRQRAAKRGKNAVARGPADSSVMARDETIGDAAKG
jgi:hypothetical protein